MSEQYASQERNGASADDQNAASELQSEVSAISSLLASLSGLSQSSREKVIRSVSAFFGLGFARESEPSHVGVRWGPASSTTSEPAHGTFSEDRTMSPKEFMLEKKPIQDIERVVTLAYYLTHYRDTPHFKTLDLSKLNTEAAQVKFSNAAKAVDNATKAGLLVQAVKGMKQISSKGELYVQALPDRMAAKEAVAHFRQRRKVRRGRGGSTLNAESVAKAQKDSGDE
jgi:hypothetical protein